MNIMLIDNFELQSRVSKGINVTQKKHIIFLKSYIRFFLINYNFFSMLPLSYI